MTRTERDAHDEGIAVGTPHRALRDITVLVYVWDELRISTAVMRAGALFQPWEPALHARPHRVPITLGDTAVAHDFGASAPEGRFLRTVDFRAACVRADVPMPGAPPRPAGESLPLPGPFDELSAIVSRLRARASSSALPFVDDTAAALTQLARAHDWAAMMELGASGFDNTESMRRYAQVQDDVLASARAALAACKRALD